MNVNYCYGLSREYVQGAVADLSDGRLIFGTTEGAVEIDPRHIRNVDYQAELHLLGLRCTNNDSEQFSRQVGQMLRKGSVELDYDSRTFEIGFEAINLRNQFDIAYQYKIGDGEWSKPTEEQSIRFVNMESGSHVLYLRSVSRTSLHVLDEIELGIVIGRPWWNSWWMRCLYALLLGGAFFGAWKIYELHTKYMRLVVSSPDVNQNRLRVADELPDGKKEGERDQFIDKTTRLIVEHLADSDFTIDRLCREMAMSRTLFYVKLKSYTANPRRISSGSSAWNARQPCCVTGSRWRRSPRWSESTTPNTSAPSSKNTSAFRPPNTDSIGYKSRQRRFGKSTFPRFSNLSCLDSDLGAGTVRYFCIPAAKGPMPVAGDKTNRNLKFYDLP